MAINMEKPYVVGMDIGGTNTVFGVVDSRGNVLASDSVKTQQYENIEEYVEAVCKKLLPLLSQFGGAEKIKGMGVGAPNGNYYSGTIEFAPKQWSDVTSLQCLFYFHFFIRFNHVTHFQVVAVRQADTTFKVSTHFFHIVLEAFQRID